MIIRKAEKNDIKAARLLYNRIANEPGIYYKPLTEENFDRIFAAPERYTVCAFTGDSIAGFAAGTAQSECQCAYITYVGVAQEHRGTGVGTALVRELEKMLAGHGGVNKIEIVFRNPAMLPWFIPGGNGADHPCAPGVDIQSAAHAFFIKNGYADWCLQNSYFLNLSEYAEPSDIAQKRKALLDSGIEITLYDPLHHHGLAELFDDIRNPGWKQNVLANTDKPIIVAADKNAGGLVCGYTGPLSIDPSGRGGFCGIGTLNAYRGRGIGKVVFCEMCRRHTLGGAKFMSLYTGDTNPARNIYETAGFKIVRSWANMRKEISSGR